MNIYKIKVTDLEGKTHEFEAPEGWRVMEIMRDHGLPMKAECGGCCACATCHVYVDNKWSGKLPSPTSEEIKMLDYAFFLKPNSRLSCQILIKEEFDGLEIILAPNSD